MTRRLPWKRDETPPPQTPRKTPAAAHSAKRKRVADDDPLRSPSTSPPPSAPAEEFMIDGASADDRYRMVEDELLATAQRFTNRLHRAEYSRLKHAAKNQNSAAIREIERRRPVVGRETAEARRRREAEGRAARQRGGLLELQGADGHGDHDHQQQGRQLQLQGSDLPWMGTSLQGLMENPTRDDDHGDDDSAPASLHQAGVTRTRAAAGFGSRLSDEARGGRFGDQDGHRREAKPMDLLAGQPQPSLSLSSSLGNPVTPQRLARRVVPGHASVGRHQAPEDVKTDAVDTKDPRLKEEVFDDDEDDPFGLKERKLRREKSRDQLRRPDTGVPPKKPPRDVIPSFL